MAGTIRYLEIEELPPQFLLESFAVDVQFLENKKGEITAGAHLLSVVVIVNGVQQIGTGALRLVNNYILGFSWGNYSMYLFNSHSKDESGTH